MLSRTNQDKVLKSLKEGNIINIISLIPTIGDEILIDSDKKYQTIELFEQIFPNKCKHSDAMKPSAYLTLGILSLLNNKGYHAIFDLLEVLELYSQADESVCKIIKKALDCKNIKSHMIGFYTLF